MPVPKKVLGVSLGLVFLALALFGIGVVFFLFYGGDGGAFPFIIQPPEKSIVVAIVEDISTSGFKITRYSPYGISEEYIFCSTLPSSESKKSIPCYIGEPYLTGTNQRVDWDYMSLVIKKKSQEDDKIRLGFRNNGATIHAFTEKSLGVYLSDITLTKYSTGKSTSRQCDVDGWQPANTAWDGTDMVTDQNVLDMPTYKIFDDCMNRDFLVYDDPHTVNFGISTYGQLYISFPYEFASVEEQFEDYCPTGQIRTISGECYPAIQTCIDNNLDGQCDPAEPVIWIVDKNGNGEKDIDDELCSDRDGDSICDLVISLFCLDRNDDGICDWDEFKYAATSCEDRNYNNICDSNEHESCDYLPYSPVCGEDNVTYANDCSLEARGVTKQYDGKCFLTPIIVRKDCSSPDIDCPSGYDCMFAAGQAGATCVKTEVVYVNVDLDCRDFSCPDGYTCKEIGTTGTFTCMMSEIVEITCETVGCPNPATQSCIGGVCHEITVGRCPDEINCADYDCSYIDPYGVLQEEPCVCNEYVGLCMLTQYELRTCDQEGVDCPDGLICVGKACVDPNFDPPDFCNDENPCPEGLICKDSVCLQKDVEIYPPIIIPYTALEIPWWAFLIVGGFMLGGIGVVGLLLFLKVLGKF